MLLEIVALAAGYGNVGVLRDVAIDVEAGGITAIIGGNGAGKTTLLGCIAGLLRVTRGSILLDGEDVTALPAHLRVERGIALVPEGRQVFPEMSVEENLRIGAITARARDAAGQSFAQMIELFPVLADRRRQMAGTLSGGEQQMLAIARGLMARPRLLILDEPTLGLAPIMTKRIFALIPELVARGTTILLAEQNVHLTLAIASRAYLMENGAVVLSGSGPELMTRPEIRRSYLGL